MRRKKTQIGVPTIERIVRYCRYLERLYYVEKRDVISSAEIGEALGLKPTQVRKDLSYFGEIGKRGVGYSVEELYFHLMGILPCPKDCRLFKIALFGAGRLGKALLDYEMFSKRGVDIVAVFDRNRQKVGKTINGRYIYHIDEAETVLRAQNVSIAIICVPASEAQSVADRIVNSGVIKGILNFAPVDLTVPKDILVSNMDISAELEKLIYFIREREYGQPLSV